MNIAARLILASALALCGSFASAAQSAINPASQSTQDVSDKALVASLPGFTSSHALVNGVQIHYVVGGKGDPIFLLPGWPETWWAYHKIMPQLAKSHRVIVMDIRGMGTSSQPSTGYEKKNMAKDVYELAKQLGYEKIHVVGHDIGSMVAYAFAANYPEATSTLTMLDVPHPDEGLYKWPLIPKVGFSDKFDEGNPFPWWFAFHQVKGLPEELLEGRAHIEQDWFFHYVLKDESAINAKDRAVYAKAYDTKAAIRAGNAWYQAFPQDIVDYSSYGKIKTPTLAVGGPGFMWLKATLEPKTENLKLVNLDDSGHFIAEEKPDQLTQLILEFVSRK